MLGEKAGRKSRGNRLGLTLSRVSLVYAAMAFALVAASCSDDDDPAPAAVTSTGGGGGTAFPYTDGNGIAEVKTVPSFTPSSLSIGGTVTVSFPVDSDTNYVQVLIGFVDVGTTNFNVYGFTGTVAVTLGTTAAIPVTVASTPSPVAGTYSAWILACPGTPCTFGQPGRNYFPADTYIIADLANATFLETTTVTPPTFTVQ